MKLDTPSPFTDHRCEVAEGPFWHDDALWWVDVNPGLLFRCSGSETDPDVWQLGRRTGAVVPRAGRPGSFYAAQQDGIKLLTLEGPEARLELIADPEEDQPNNRFNDGKLDSRGRFWAGTMSLSLDPGRGNLYCLDTDRSVRRVLSDVTLSNGLGWSPDDRFFYYIDSITHRLDVFDFDPAIGAITNRRTLADFSKSPGMPDGMCVGLTGELWVAFFGGGCVRRLDSYSGAETGRVELPCPNVTSCCFGGPEGKTLFVTTASKNTELSVYPEAGKVFSSHLPGSDFRPKTVA